MWLDRLVVSALVALKAPSSNLVQFWTPSQGVRGTVHGKYWEKNIHPQTMLHFRVSGLLPACNFLVTSTDERPDVDSSQEDP